MNNHHFHLLIFARLPKTGTNKTRLIPAIGAEAATQVYIHLINRTLNAVRRLAVECSCQVTMCFTGGTLDEAIAAFGDDISYREQVGTSLGDRLQHATRLAFRDGAKRVVVIGTDCPSATADDLKTAFDHLANHDVVIGPASDGGYYLIGMNADHCSLFANVDWSTSVVFEQTIQKAQLLGLSVAQMRMLPDVDNPEDLLPLRHCLQGTTLPFSTQAGKLTVVIPTLNEEANLPSTLRSVGEASDDLEVIVVDAGSNDQTVAIAQQHGCKVFNGTPGRANQMNAGAAIASGEQLLFLHGDTQLPEGYRQEIRRVLALPVVCGAFPLAIHANGFALRMIEAGVSFRSQVLQMPYGDQALFFRSADFYLQNGFKPMAIMEDYDLVVRIRKTGKIGFANKPVSTSARRWIKRGIFRTTVVNQICLTAYHLGFSDKTIARLYRRRVV
jgi:rSAM/selenodomain-associated transferase 2/rSAM/selenodomain-associated transferase 1